MTEDERKQAIKAVLPDNVDGETRPTDSVSTDFPLSTDFPQLIGNDPVSADVFNLVNRQMLSNDKALQELISTSSGGGIKLVERKNDTLKFTNSDSTTLSVSINDITHATNADNATKADTATKADSATKADEATKATNDSNGLTITSYIKGVEANSDGTELTITKGDGTSTKLTIGSSTYVDTTEPWSADVTEYTANKSLVTYEQSLYLCIVTHKPTNFEKDLSNGYWKQIDSDQTVIGSASGYSQIVKKNITAPKTLTIAINDTPSLCLPPVECLKAGTQETNVEVKANTYDTSEDAIFNHNSGVTFTDSGVLLKTSYSVDMTIPTALDSGYISESDYIDLDEYKSVEEVSV